MLGGIPAYALDAEARKFLYVSLAAGYYFRRFGVDVAIIAELAVSDAFTVAVVDAAFPAYPAVAVPPCVVVSCCLVDVVGHNVDDNLDSVVGCFLAEVLELGFGADASFECKVVRTVKIMPGRTCAHVRALHGRQLHRSEAGGRNIRELGFHV